jgi:hypothetical protein
MREVVREKKLNGKPLEAYKTTSTVQTMLQVKTR